MPTVSKCSLEGLWGLGLTWSLQKIRLVTKIDPSADF